MSKPAGSHTIHRIDPTSGLVLSRMSGTVSGEDMLAFVETVHADPLWRETYDVIWDCSQVTAHIVLPSDVGPIVDEAVSDVTGRGVLVESQSVGGSLIAELLAAKSRQRGHDIVVCKTIGEALDALGRERLSDTLQTFLDAN